MLQGSPPERHGDTHSLPVGSRPQTMCSAVSHCSSITAVNEHFLLGFQCWVPQQEESVPWLHIPALQASPKHRCTTALPAPATQYCQVSSSWRQLDGMGVHFWYNIWHFPRPCHQVAPLQLHQPVECRLDRKVVVFPALWAASLRCQSHLSSLL